MRSLIVIVCTVLLGACIKQTEVLPKPVYCNDAAPCPTGAVCVAETNTCVWGEKPDAVSSCTLGTACEDGKGLCQEGKSGNVCVVIDEAPIGGCRTDNDCLGGRICKEGYCVMPDDAKPKGYCDVDSECKEGLKCDLDQHTCYKTVIETVETEKECAADADCITAEMPKSMCGANGYCYTVLATQVTVYGGCLRDDECGDGYVCKDERCKKPPVCATGLVLNENYQVVESVLDAVTNFEVRVSSGVMPTTLLRPSNGDKLFTSLVHNGTSTIDPSLSLCKEATLKKVIFTHTVSYAPGQSWVRPALTVTDGTNPIGTLTALQETYAGSNVSVKYSWTGSYAIPGGASAAWEVVCNNCDLMPDHWTTAIRFENVVEYSVAGTTDVLLYLSVPPSSFFMYGAPSNLPSSYACGTYEDNGQQVQATSIMRIERALGFGQYKQGVPGANVTLIGIRFSTPNILTCHEAESTIVTFEYSSTVPVAGTMMKIYNTSNPQTALHTVYLTSDVGTATFVLPPSSLQLAPGTEQVLEVRGNTSAATAGNSLAIGLKSPHSWIDGVTGVQYSYTSTDPDALRTTHVF